MNPATQGPTPHPEAAASAELWQRAQKLEAAGQWEQARALYETLLATHPQHVPARLRMSRMEQVAGRYQSSRQHALQAADAVRLHASTRHIAFVTARLLEFAEETEVASVILSAEGSDPDVIRQSPTLAQHLWLAGRYEDTLRFLDAMDRRVPGHPLLAFTRANVLRYLGDADGAQRLYETALTRAPHHPDIHWALSTHSRAQPPLARVERLRAALPHHPAGSVEQAHLLYALFREHDAAGEVDKAWDALSQGAAIMRSRVSYDPRVEGERLDALRALRPGALIASESHADPIPVFIVGMPRTGTTLLDRVVGNHGWARSLGERNDLSAAISEASGRFFQSVLQADQTDLLQSLDMRRVGQLYMARLRRIAPPVRFVIDKNPQNLFNIPVILQALPQARILCLRRDPMDACFSTLKELFQGDAYPYSYALDDMAEHCRHARSWMAHWQAVAPASVRVVDYEALVADPQGTAASVLEFVGLPAQEGVHEITRNEAPVATASSSQVREGIHDRGVGAWKRYAQHLQPLIDRLER